jgi:hypothetical protein
MGKTRKTTVLPCPARNSTVAKVAVAAILRRRIRFITQDGV